MDSTNMWTKLRTRQIGIGGGRGTEISLIIALVVVIGGSLALTIYTSLGKGRTNLDIKPMYFCEVCEKEFEIDYSKQSPEERLGMMEMGPGMMKLPDCPLCGATEAGLPMVKCPNTECEKYYVGESADFHKRMAAGEMGMDQEQPRDICPHCGTDRIQWYKDHRKKRKKKK